MKQVLFSVRSRLVAGCVAIIGLSAVTGCSKSVDNYADTTNVPVAGLMAFNLASDKVVSTSLSGNTLTGFPLNYTSYTGNYLRIYPGTRTFESRDAYTGNLLATTPYAFDSSRYYSAFVVGANGMYKNVVVNDDFDSLMATNGQAYVRYINAIPDSVNTPNVTITANGSPVSNRTATYGTVSGFTAVTPGTVNIVVSNGSSVNKDRSITLEQQKVYTVLLLGNPGSGNTADSIQIRYITNGTLDNTTDGQRATSTNAQNSNLK